MEFGYEDAGAVRGLRLGGADGSAGFAVRGCR